MAKYKIQNSVSCPILSDNSITTNKQLEQAIVVFSTGQYLFQDPSKCLVVTQIDRDARSPTTMRLGGTTSTPL